MEIISHYGNDACKSTLSYISEDPTTLCQDPRLQWSALFSIAAMMAWGAYTLYNKYPVLDMKNATLFEHAKLGNLKGVKRAINNKEDLNQQDPTGNTALNWACQKGHYTIAKELIAAGVDLHLENTQKRTPLHSVCDSQHLPIIELLLKAGQEKSKKLGVNKRDSAGETSLMIASRRGYALIAEALLNSEKKVRLDAQNGQGQTALHLAARESAPIIKKLLEKKANPNQQDKTGQLPIHHAADQDNAETLALLLPKTNDPNHQSVDGSTALHKTCHYQKDRLKAARVLVNDQRVNVNVRNNEGISPFHEACLGISGDWDLAEIMLASGRCDLTQQEKTEEGNTPVHIAVNTRAKDLFSRMLKSGGFDLTSVNGKNVSVFEAILGNRDERFLKSTLDYLGMEKFQGVEISGLSPIEWATITNNRYLEEKLNGRGIYFQYSKQKKARLIQATIQHAVSPLKHFFTSRIPIKIKEFKEFFEDLEALQNNMNAPLKQPYLIALVENAAKNFLKNCELRAQHKQQKTHVPLFDLTFDSVWFVWNSLLQYAPPDLRHWIELEMSNEAPLPVPMNFPPQAQWLLREEYSLQDVERLRSFLEIMTKINPILANPFQMLMQPPAHLEEQGELPIEHIVNGGGLHD